MGKMKKFAAKDFNNRNIEILLLYNEDQLSFVKCRSNAYLEQFLTGIMPYLTEENLPQCIDFFFRHRHQQSHIKISIWLSINVSDYGKEKPKRKTGSNNSQYSWTPYDRLVYLIGHNKTLKEMQLDCKVKTDEQENQKVVITLKLNAKVSETYEADIIDNDVRSAKDKTAAIIIERLGF